MAKSPRFDPDPHVRADERMLDIAADEIVRKQLAEQRRGTLTLVPFSTLTMKRVRWLWDGRLASGRISLLAGREGSGKSTISADLGAAITVGKLPGEYLGTPRSVVVVATEDDYEATIMPRLTAAGADLDRVYFMRSTVGSEGMTMPEDLPALETLALEHDAALLIMDPLISRLGSLDTHKDADVRHALEPLGAVAGACAMAVLGLIHLNKTSTSDPLRALMGSTGFSAVPRSVLMAGHDPDDESRTQRLLSHPKNNLGPPAPTLRYTITSKVVGEDDGDIVTSRVAWGDEDPRNAWELAASTADDRGHKRKSAAAWLEDYIAQHGGEVDAAHAKLAGELELGLSQQTIHRAAGELGVVRKKQPDRSVLWSLP